MKIIFTVSRAFFILFVWTIGYFFWFQRFMLTMWGFNPMSKVHWIYIWNEWQNGWVIQSVKEWMFVITLFAMLPVWFTGWAVLCAVPWIKWFKIILLFPIRFISSKIKERKKEKNAAKPKITKKKSSIKLRQRQPLRPRKDINLPSIPERRALRPTMFRLRATPLWMFYVPPVTD